MNKFLILLSLLLISVPIFAEDYPKHQLIFGNSFGTGWSGSASNAKVDSDLNIKDFNLTNGEFKINYAYSVTSRFQLGIDLASEKDTSEIKARSGGKIKSESSDSSILIFGIINFSERLQDSFYFGAGIGRGKNESETKDSTDGTTETSETEYDGDIFYFTFGKRFNLKFMGIENLTYSPSISYQRINLGGDLEDAGVKSIESYTLDLIKFDLLF